MDRKNDIKTLAEEFEQCQKILKDAGILKVRKEATKNFYYFDPDMKSFDLLVQMLQKAKRITEELPERSRESYY